MAIVVAAVAVMVVVVVVMVVVGGGGGSGGVDGGFGGGGVGSGGGGGGGGGGDGDDMHQLFSQCTSQCPGFGRLAYAAKRRRAAEGTIIVAVTAELAAMTCFQACSCDMIRWWQVDLSENQLDDACAPELNALLECR